jgi:hypothetical protein
MNTDTMDHVGIAVALSTDEATLAGAKTAQTCARQGDLNMRRTGDAPPKVAATDCPRGGWLLSAGQHGEHRGIARGPVKCEAGRLTIPDGSTVVVVHTDVPHARHGAIVVPPGKWECWRSRELSTADTIIEVQD